MNYRRIILALILAPLILLPAWLFVSIVNNAYAIFSSDDYYRTGRFFSSGEIAILFYTVGVAHIVTLVYGIPVYLALNHFKRANAATLSAAGFVVLMPIGGVIFSLLGALVAVCFWLIVKPCNDASRKLIRVSALTIAGFTIVLVVLTMLVDKYYLEEINDFRLERTLSKKLPTPVWWESVTENEKIESLLDARSLHSRVYRYGTKTEQLQQLNREFFKAAFIAVRNTKLSSDVIVEIVSLMDLPYVDYPHMFELQKYALSLPVTELITRLLLLQQMLNTYAVDSEQHGHARSLSYDLIIESGSRISEKLLAPFCKQLALEYHAQETNHFEISVFKTCVRQISIKADELDLHEYIRTINKQISLMEDVLTKGIGDK